MVADRGIQQVAHPQLSADGDADVRGGAPDVEGDDVVEAGRLGRPDPTQQTSHRTGHHECHRLSCGAADRGHASGGLHDLDLVAEPEVLDHAVQLVQVTADRRSDEGIEGSGGEPLVLAVERDDPGGNGEIDAWGLFLDDLRDPLLVHRIQVRVEQTYCDGFHATVEQRPDLFTDLVLVQWDEHLTVGGCDALGDGHPVTSFDERAALPWEFLLEREVHRLLVSGDVEDIPEAFGGDEANPCPLAGERDVGGDGGAVDNLVDVRDSESSLLGHGEDAVDHGFSGVVRGGGHFLHGDDAVLVKVNVGEGAADVDSDTLHCCSLGAVGCGVFGGYRDVARCHGADGYCNTVAHDGGFSRVNSRLPHYGQMGKHSQQTVNTST